MHKSVGTSSRIQILGTGRYLVRSKTDESVWYGVVDGICECKGYEYKQKCNHVEHLITHGYLDPAQVEGYHRNQRYPPVKLADPEQEHRYPFWIAGYLNPLVPTLYRKYATVELTKKPYGLVGYPLDYTVTFGPSETVLRMVSNEPETAVEVYRKELNTHSVDAVMAELAKLKCWAGDRDVVLLTSGLDITGPTGFANPRRVLATWIYERTKQVVPEMWRARND